ncbi:hypothetical protein Poly24_09940 [Rosistilla carotiformis]|uniref:Cytochrome c domain-containing protein n=1 Tax=Rosistilla carotiformis TaxID=2528017 RepID=A0A518JP58_9BACT|nr:hypothetical protein [Rosistilla carotiformis]QDV67301.1 hypothetical protein Poly24_09940 [Rosistilla carotiformis]
MLRVLLLTIAMTVTASQAMAIGELKKEWSTKYAGDDSGDFKTVARKAGCNVCHVKGVKDKKSAEGRNEYGTAMAAFLKGKDIKIDDLKAQYKDDSTKDAAVKTMMSMFETVNAEKSKDGETFGAKISAGKLPATDANL